MKLTSKPKHYGPLSVASGETLTMRTPGGYEFKTGAEGDVDTMSPGELLMASLASCLILSLQMVARAGRTDTGAISLRVNAYIDGGEVRRFDRFDVQVSMSAITDRSVADTLLVKAKSLCTVSHTLQAEVRIEFIA